MKDPAQGGPWGFNYETAHFCERLRAGKRLLESARTALGIHLPGE